MAADRRMGGSGRRFAFTAIWRLPAPADEVYAALADVERYPVWWPQIRAVSRLSDTAGDALVRSRLPLTLRLRLTREIEDPGAGVLRVGMVGDLTGWAQFALIPAESGTLADYRQEVVVTKRGLRVLARPLAPLLRANHDSMMRAGERGLTAYLGTG